MAAFSEAPLSETEVTTFLKTQGVIGMCLPVKVCSTKTSSPNSTVGYLGYLLNGAAEVQVQLGTGTEYVSKERLFGSELEDEGEDEGFGDLNSLDVYRSLLDQSLLIGKIFSTLTRASWALYSFMVMLKDRPLNEGKFLVLKATFSRVKRKFYYNEGYDLISKYDLTITGGYLVETPIKEFLTQGTYTRTFESLEMDMRE